MNLEHKEQLKEQAYSDCIKGFCPNVDDPYNLPKIRCECGYVGPAHGQLPQSRDLYCKHCQRLHDESKGNDIPEKEWRLPND